MQSISTLKVRAQRNAAGDMEAARGYRHTGLDKRGSDINGARKLAGLNANQADGALATNDAVRRYFDECFVVSAGRGSTSKPSTCRRLTLSARPFRQES